MVIESIGQFLRGNVVLRLLSVVNLAIVTPLLVRVLGVDDYGYYTYLTNVVFVLAMFMSLGINEYCVLYNTSEPNKQKRAKIFHTLLRFRLLYLPVAVFALYYILKTDIFSLKVHSDYIPMVLFGAVAFSLYHLSEMLNRLLQMGHYYTTKIMWLTATLGVFIYVIYTHENSQTLLYMEAWANAIFGITIVYLIIKSIPYAKPDFSVLRSIWGKCSILFLSGGAAFLMHLTDRYFLMQYYGKTELGLYGLAIAISAGVSAFVLFPVKDFMMNFVTHASREQDPHLKNRVINGFTVIFPTLIMPFILGLAIYGEPFVRLYGGDDFVQSHPFIIWLGGGIFIYAFAIFLLESAMLQDDKKLKLMMGVNLVLLALNIPLNIILIQHYGAIGAAYATFITQLVAVTIILYMVWHRDKIASYTFSSLWLWLILAVVYGVGYQIWDKSHGFMAMLIYCALSWGAILALSALLSEPRALFFWLISNIREKYKQN